MYSSKGKIKCRKWNIPLGLSSPDVANIATWGDSAVCHFGCWALHEPGLPWEWVALTLSRVFILLTSAQLEGITCKVHESEPCSWVTMKESPQSFRSVAGFVLGHTRNCSQPWVGQACSHGFSLEFRASSHRLYPWHKPSGRANSRIQQSLGHSGTQTQLTVDTSFSLHHPFAHCVNLSNQAGLPTWGVVSSWFFLSCWRGLKRAWRSPAEFTALEPCRLPRSGAENNESGFIPCALTYFFEISSHLRLTH